MPERKYNEAELAAILRAAAEAQSAGPTNTEQNSGYSLGDIERLASEVGIDPKHIAAAAENLPLEKAVERRFRFWGAPSRVMLERNYQGSLDENSWEETVGELRLAFGNAGTASMVGSSHEWTGGNDFRNAHLSATPRGDKTRLRLAVNQKDMLVVAWMAGIILTLMGMGITGGFLHARGAGNLTSLGCLVVAMLGYWVVHQLVIRWNATNLANAQALLDRIEALTPNQVIKDRTSLDPQEDLETLKLRG